MGTARGKKKGSARDANRTTGKKKPTTKKAPARRRSEPPEEPLSVSVTTIPGALPEIDDLPRFPSMPPDMTEPLDLDDLDEVLRNHTFQLERSTRDLPELQRLEAEVKETRERIKHRILGQLMEDGTAENKALVKRFPKPTVAIYSAEVELDEWWQQAQVVLRAIRERIAEVGRIQILFEHRRTVIRGLIELYAAEYWGISDKAERDRVGRSDGNAPARGGRRAFRRDAN